MNREEKIFIGYVSSLADMVYKILPLYEEKNEGLFIYVQSLIYELEGLKHVVEDMESSSNYVSLLCVLESLSDDCIVPLGKDHPMQKVIKREVFKCLDIVKNIRQEIHGD